MNVNELVAHAKESNEKLADLHNGNSTQLIRAIFAAIVKEVEGGEVNTAVRIPGLGVFRKHELDRQKDGVPIKITRFIFRPASDKPKTTA